MATATSCSLAIFMTSNNILSLWWLEFLLSQKSEVRSQKLEVRSQKLEIISLKMTYSTSDESQTKKCFSIPSLGARSLTSVADAGLHRCSLFPVPCYIPIKISLTANEYLNISTE